MKSTLMFLATAFAVGSLVAGILILIGLFIPSVSPFNSKDSHKADERLLVYVIFILILTYWLQYNDYLKYLG